MDPKWRNVIVIVVVVAIVAAGIGVYYASRSTGCGTSLKSANPLKVDQSEIPDSLDPAVTFTTPGWAAVQQVYQGLVNYNGSSSTNFSGVLAKDWTISYPYNSATGNNTESVTFHLRSGVHFSNGDPYNAYVEWYSLYRDLVMQQPSQFILEENFYSTNFDASNPLGYYSSNASVHAANVTLTNYLNTFNFFNPNATDIALMETVNQSFQVIDNLTIQLNLGYGYLASNYTYLFASLSAPNSYAVDPAWIGQHGGVSLAETNAYLSTNTLGTGQYILGGYSGVTGGGYSLVPNTNYWGASAAAQEPWYYMLPPAKSSFDVVFQGSDAVTISDLKTGTAALASFAYIGPSTISQINNNPCIVVQALPTVYGSTSGSWWVFMDVNQFPFNNLSVREAVAHAIDYSQIIQSAFGGYASQWVGPVPPSYPYYNPASLPPYAYNLTLAQQEIANSPCANDACKGMSINYAYLKPGEDWLSATTYIAADLAQIGITINPVGIELKTLISEQSVDPATGVCTSNEAVNGGPFYMGQEFYTSDYIAPDDWTQNDALTAGSANACMAQYSNGTMDTLVYQAAAESNPANLTQDYTTMTNLLYNNYSEIWLVVPTSFAVYSVHLQGIHQNPMASAEPYAMLFNTQYAC